MLSLWAWHRLDLFQPYLDVSLPDGSVSRQPNALTTVDHPWHGARFSLLLDALGDGHPLRWVGGHQGGFPVEFYPLGAGLIDLAVWTVTLGHLPTPLVHTYAVGLTFLLPLVGFLLLASLCRVSLWVAVLAGAAHLCVRGWWWSGGSMELVEWGLITNVAAATSLFLAVPLVVRLMAGWSGPAAGGAAALLAMAVVTNPRSAVAGVAIAVAVVASALIQGDVRGIARRLAAPAALAVGLAAPLLLPLVRYRDLYYFVQYTGYASIEEWYRSSVQAVSGPVALLAVAGVVMGLLPGTPRAAQVLALTLIAYAAMTVSLIQIEWPGSLLDQLETTRLMPFQRLMMIATAATGVGLMLERMRLPASAKHTVPAVITVAVAVLYVAEPPSFIPDGDRGLVRIGTYADASMVDLEHAVKEADSRAQPNTAVLVLGSTVSWHAQLWSPTWSDRRFFYDDWLWYWQREHVGDYDPDTEHAYRSDASALNPAYLATHGIGAVVVTGDARRDAAGASWLSPMTRGGAYDTYLVREPTEVVTVEGISLVQYLDRQDRIAVSVVPSDSAGRVVVRTNWFPRWEAVTDGPHGENIPVDVIHRADGYMEVELPPGTRSVEFSYVVTRLDQLARAISGMTLVALILMLSRRLWLRPIARSEPR